MRYFVTSDLHSHLTPLLMALQEKGYDKDNPDHTLIIAGDLFDRGDETVQLYQWLMTIPRERLALIRGNHEDLFVEALRSDLPSAADIHNGTVKTFSAISGIDEMLLDPDSEIYDCLVDDLTDEGKSLEEIADRLLAEQRYHWKQAKKAVRASEIGQFILEKGNWVNFVETNSYIITHGFIPIRLNKKLSGYVYSYFRNWRTKATKKQWEDARWSNYRFAYELVDNGLFDEEYKAGKKLVCGHTAARYFREYYFGSDEPYSDHTGNDIVETPKLIALDACTFVSGMVNVLVFDE